MDERLARIIRGVSTIADLKQLESNIRQRSAMTPDVEAAIRTRSAELGRALITERTGLDLTELTPAEEKIVEAVSEYVGVMKRQGKEASRTFLQLRNRGLIDAAEAAVANRQPTQGYKTLAEANLSDLSFEQIVLDHQDEFSPRAAWFSRRTLGLPNESEKPPASAVTPIQARTEILVRWLKDRAQANGGRIPAFTNAEAAAVLGMGDLQRSGRAYGNIQSRIDFGCYAAGLPPLGCAAEAPFDNAWGQEGRRWAFPVSAMQAAAQSRLWSTADFDAILWRASELPGRAYIPWRKALTIDEAAVRAWAYGPASSSESSLHDPPNEPSATRNPVWSRDELILALELYLRFRGRPPAKDSAEIADLSGFLGRLGRARGLTEAATYRNANGVYMKLMNISRFDPDYAAAGKMGLSRGNQQEEAVWNEFAEDPFALSLAVAEIRASVDGGAAAVEEDARPIVGEDRYWAFVCNPKRWAIDRFLARGIEHDSWGVRSSDRDRFAPGQLGLVRVGVDRRTRAERGGQPPLAAGIYALCEVESEAFESTGEVDEFWADGEAQPRGRPTVKIRYLKSFAERPLTIEQLREEQPNLSHLLLNGFQDSSFPISAADFRSILAMLLVDPENLPDPAEPTILPDGLTGQETKYLYASPEVKERVSKVVERGPTGALAKQATGFKCQLCEALGLPPIGFVKRGGEPYVEAHHVMPVHQRQVGSLALSNIMTLCANHHRQAHYGEVEISIEQTTFDILIDDQFIQVPRLGLSQEATVS